MRKTITKKGKNSQVLFGNAVKKQNSRKNEERRKNISAETEKVPENVTGWKIGVGPPMLQDTPNVDYVLGI